MPDVQSTRAAPVAPSMRCTPSRTSSMLLAAALTSRESSSPIRHAPTSLLLPRIAHCVIAGSLPEARAIVLDELDGTNPLCTLPCVEPRDDESEREAVLRVERHTIVPVREHRVLLVEPRDR